MTITISTPYIYTGMIHDGYYYVVTEREHYLQDIALECLWEKRYSIWSDVWSNGILAYKVITMEVVTTKEKKQLKDIQPEGGAQEGGSGEPNLVPRPIFL